MVTSSLNPRKDHHVDYARTDSGFPVSRPRVEQRARTSEAGPSAGPEGLGSSHHRPVPRHRVYRQLRGWSVLVSRFTKLQTWLDNNNARLVETWPQIGDC